ncbi:MAG: hypothetical protein C0501_03810 [Isosphaera sp.]|nr:hypothetical protein [Isosphaera sp.]
MTANTHDATVAKLAGVLRAHFAGAGEWDVFIRIGWDRPENVGPGGAMTFDLAVAAAGTPVTTDGRGPRLGPDVLPALVFEVITKDGWEEEYYDKPDLLMNAGVREYYLYDPTAEAMRPPFQAWRLRKGVYRPFWTTCDGVAFSDLGFRLEFVGPDPRVSPCGPAELEEDLFDAERHLGEAVERADRERRAVEGLTAEVNRLRAALGGAGP